LQVIKLSGQLFTNDITFWVVMLFDYL